MTRTGRDRLPSARARARTPAAASTLQTRSLHANRRHIQHREGSRCATYLEHWDGVVHHNDWSCRFISHLRAEHKQQLEISAVCTKSTPPLWQSVRVCVQGWVQEQRECLRNGGQQLAVHGAARHTVESKCSRRWSLTLLSSAPPESHRPSTLVPYLRGATRWTSLEHIPRAAAPSPAFCWPLGAVRHHAKSGGGQVKCRIPCGR